jgi:hypothetical protein
LLVKVTSPVTFVTVESASRLSSFAFPVSDKP